MNEENHIAPVYAINCTNDLAPATAITSEVRYYLSNSLAPSTKRAYAADLAHYAGTGRSIPSSPEQIAAYAAEMVGAYALATIQRRLITVSKAHRAAGADDPVKTELVASTMRGIRRAMGAGQRQAKALLRDDLFAMLDQIGSVRSKNIRDRALLLLGFSTAMRRSELVALDVEDIEFVPKGLMVMIRKSKTDQEQRGRSVAVPYGRSRYCPVTNLRAWLQHAEITSGPIFRAVDKGGKISADRVSGEAVSHVIKKWVTAAGYDPANFSGHSLRAGFATSAAQAGASSHKIRQVTGHKSDAMLSRYIRDTELFEDNATARVL